MFVIVMWNKIRHHVMKKCLIFLGFVSCLLLTLLISMSNVSVYTNYGWLPDISWLKSHAYSPTSAEVETENRSRYRFPLVANLNDTDLNEEIGHILEAVIDAFFTTSSTSSDVPSCKGDRQHDEVEDIFCIPRPKFLKEVKNPCWLDDGLSVDEKSRMVRNSPSLPSSGNHILRCLPYFHILGCEKCGSSDLWKRITSHPHVVRITGTMQKEANWWAWGRYGYFSYRYRPVRTFLDYTESFMQVTTRIAHSLQGNLTEHKMLISGDGTPSDMMDFRGWPNITQNRGLASPDVLTPHLMRHIYPNPKFIIIFRNPVDRLVSDYYFINSTWQTKSPEEFHRKLLVSIRILAQCVHHRNIRQCAFDPVMYRAMPLRLHYLFYSLFLPEWFKLFPKDNFLILKTEEYANNINGTVKACMDFLGLEPLNDREMQKISQEQRYLVSSNKKRKGDDVLPHTRLILEALAKPAKRIFADMMGDERFNWNPDT